MPPEALNPTLRRPEAMVSKMMLAASGVAETSVLPVEVLINEAPLSIQNRVASAISDACGNAPLSIMTLSGVFLGLSSALTALKKALQVSRSPLKKCL